MKSLARNAPELGDVEGARRRIESESGASVLANLKICGKGFSLEEAMEWESVGERGVGGSYLLWNLHQRGYEKVSPLCLPDTHDKNSKFLHR